jgi:flagellar motility protein MotE (MotC chaperone)
MKNFLILGLLAAFLFSVSAGLSVWLNQSKQPESTEKDKDKDKPVAKGPKSDAPKESTEAPKTAPKADVSPPSSSESALLIVRENEAKLKLRADQIALVVRDLQTQREATEAALQSVTNELKKVSTETSRLDALAEDLKKKKVEFEAGEKKNIEKMAAMYDAMSPEAAAPVLKEMANSGRLEMGAKILVQMKERNAARVLEAMNDPSLALQYLEKIRGIRATTTPPAGAPAPSPVTPAKGP